MDNSFLFKKNLHFFLDKIQNFQLTLAYQGTCYKGWQKTKEGRSIEETLEKALLDILGHSINLQAASRTDAGVHAKAQVVNFFSSVDIHPQQLQKSLNGILPRDISVVSVQPVDRMFHPTLHSFGKIYHYNLCHDAFQLPFNRLFSWHYPYPKLDIDSMQRAANLLRGKHDFSAFTMSPLIDNVREIFSIDIIPLPCRRLRIEIFGDKFLYKMVRIIVGTLVYMGSNRLKAEDILKILYSKNRKNAGITAPAHGLCLYKVQYKLSL